MVFCCLYDIILTSLKGVSLFRPTR